MATPTTYYNLLKPISGELFDLNEYNSNLDKIDQAIHDKVRPFGHLGKTNGFQALTTAGQAVTMPATAQLIRGGMTVSNNKLIVPIAGLYILRCKAYATAGSVYKHTALCTLNGAATGAIVELSKPDADDYQGMAECTVALNANDAIGMNAYCSVTGESTWGTTGYDGAFFEVEYSQA